MSTFGIQCLYMLPFSRLYTKILFIPTPPSLRIVFAYPFNKTYIDYVFDDGSRKLERQDVEVQKIARLT